MALLEPDLFGGQFMGYIGPTYVSTRHSHRPNKHQQPYEIGCDVYIKLRDDIDEPTDIETRHRLLAQKKADIVDYIDTHLREHRKNGVDEFDKIVEKVSLGDDYIRISRRKNYGSDDTRENVGRPIIKEWKEKIRTKLFEGQHILETKDNRIFPTLCISPNYPFTFDNNDYTSLVVWAQHGSAIDQRHMLEEALNDINDQFRPNETGTTIKLVDHVSGDHIKIRLQLTKEQNNRAYRSKVRETLANIAKAVGGNYVDVPAHDVPEHVIKKLKDRGIEAEKTFPNYRYIYYEHETQPELARSHSSELPSNSIKHRLQIGIAPSLDITQPGDYEIKSRRRQGLKEAKEFLQEACKPFLKDGTRVSVKKQLDEYLDVKVTTKKSEVDPSASHQQHRAICEKVKQLLENKLEADRQTELITAKAYATSIEKQKQPRNDHTTGYVFHIQLTGMPHEQMKKNMNKLWNRLVFQLNNIEAPVGLKVWRNEEEHSLTIQVLATQPELAKIMAEEVQKKITRSNHLPIRTAEELNQQRGEFGRA